MRALVAAALLASGVAAAAPEVEILAPAPAPPAPDARALADALPDGIPGRGANDIAAAWLAAPTRRYDHAALGDPVEAGEVRVRTRDGRELRHVLGPDSVYEDLRARVTDIDGDGRDEVLVVRSRFDAGASLALLGVRDGRLVTVAETPPIGRARRWANPVGIADVDGDGQRDVLAVLTPHIGGTLVVYGYGPAGFVEKARVAGFSNHVLGSRAMGLAALLDVDGDGIADAVVPSADRTRLRVVSFAGGTPRELDGVALPAKAAGSFSTGVATRVLIVPLEDGRRARIVWR
jgi:hypothetical protein